MQAQRQSRTPAADARVNTYGRGERDVVLIHGLAGLFNSWEHNIPELSRHFRVHEVLLPDYRDTREGFDIEDLSASALGALEPHRLRRPAVIGHSVGGLVAARLAATPSAGVSELVLVASSGVQTGADAMRRMLHRQPSRERLAAILGTIFHDPTPFEARLTDTAHTHFSDRARFRGLLRTARKLKEQSIREVLHRIDVPTLIVWGKDDQILPVDAAGEFVRCMKRVRLEIFNDCGHAPQIEHPGQFNRLVVEVLGAA